MLPPPPKYRAKVYKPNAKYDEANRKRNQEKKERIALAIKEQAIIMKEKPMGYNTCHCGKHKLEHQNKELCYYQSYATTLRQVDFYPDTFTLIIR